MVARRLGMPFHPVPDNVMLCGCIIKRPPQIRVLYRLTGAGFPAIALPGVNPSLDTLFHVLRIGVDLDGPPPIKANQRADHRGELHPIVHRGSFATDTPARLALVQTEPATPSCP